MKKYPWPVTLLWSAALIGCGVMACFNPIAAAVCFVLVLILLAFDMGGGGKHLVTALLIGSLAIAGAPPRGRAQQTNSPPSTVECNAVIIGGVVIIVGAFIIYKLVKFCKKNLAPPPPPPPTPPPTNAPPPMHLSSTVTHVNALSDSAQVNGMDISNLGWVDNTIATNPVPFLDYVHLTMSNSVDMTTWSNLYTIGIWMSSNSVEMVIYDGTGKATHTNWTAGNPYATSLTNNLPFKVYDSTKPQQFFKYAP